MPLVLGQNPQDDEENRKRAALGLMAAPAGGVAGPGGSIEALTNPFGQVAQVPHATVGTIADAGAGLGFNEKYAPLSRQIDQGVLAQQYQQHDALVGLDSQYQRQLVESDKTAQDARRMLASRMAGNGISRSGIAAGAVGEQEQSAAQFKADLANWLAGSQSQVRAGFVNNVNELYGQRQQLYGQQTTEEAAARAEAARIEAERVANEQAAARQAEQLRVQQQAAAQAAEAQRQLLASIAAQQYSAPSYGGGGGYSGGGGGGGYSAPAQAAPQQFSPNWNVGAAPWEDIAAYGKQFYSGRDGQNRPILRPGAEQQLIHALSTDADFSGMMQNSMGKYYGGAGSLQDVARWLLNPRMNEAAARDYGGVW